MKICKIPLVIFETTSQVFFKLCFTLPCHETYFLVNFLAVILYSYNKTTLLYKVSSWKSEILHFDGLLCPNHIKFKLKKSAEELSLIALKSDTKFKEKLICCFKYDIRNLVNFHPTTQKSENFSSIVFFCPKYMRFELKNTDELFFMALNNDGKFE